MRFYEECPYITPCGYCSRQQKPCEKKAVDNRKRYGIPVAPPDSVAATLKVMEEEMYKSIRVDEKVLAAEEKEG